MTNYDVVKKLIGEIEPIGETRTDGKRLGNLKEMTDLADQILTDIDYLRRYKTSNQYSVKQSGELADKFFKRIGITD